MLFTSHIKRGATLNSHDNKNTLYFLCVGKESTTEKPVADSEIANQLDTISEKSSIKDIKDDNTEVEEEVKEADKTIDLKNMDESSV